MSGAAGLAVMTGACLVTTDPQFKGPERTPPLLLVDAANPDPRQIIFLGATENTKTFSAYVRSEDVDDDLEVRILRDYGVPINGRPFQGLNLASTIPPGHADEDRLVTATWYDSENPISAGCHRLTLMVTHAFGDDGCSKDANDYDAITWTVIRCGSDGCPPSDPALYLCEEPTASCRKTEVAEGGGGTAP